MDLFLMATAGPPHSWRNIEVLLLVGKLGDETKCCEFPNRSNLFLSLNQSQEYEPHGEKQTSMIHDPFSSCQKLMDTSL